MDAVGIGDGIEPGDDPETLGGSYGWIGTAATGQGTREGDDGGIGHDGSSMEGRDGGKPDRGIRRRSCSSEACFPT